MEEFVGRFAMPVATKRKRCNPSDDNEDSRKQFRRGLGIIRCAQTIEELGGSSAWEILAAYESKEKWALKQVKELRDALCRQKFG